MRNRPRKDEAKACDYRARQALKMAAMCMKNARGWKRLADGGDQQGIERRAFWVAMARTYTRSARGYRASARRERAHQAFMRRHPATAQYLAGGY